MSISSALLDSLDDGEPADKTYGVVVALVTSAKDPDGLGRSRSLCGAGRPGGQGRFAVGEIGLRSVDP